ncbi:hypothetical protein CRE_22394 [Caenorhabditis remanei]|uniref:JmjC domain-containing protein n=1 Tax=Caenorhabditis remanei TaxID=31234 RepID=E3MDX0_CAERE|nr:hypothetical protein CRE_22394 [Caenorhabditis remanei]
MPPKRSDDHSLKRSRDKTPHRGRQESPERGRSQRRNSRESPQRRQRDASPPDSSCRNAAPRRSNTRREFQVPMTPHSPTPTKKIKPSSGATSSSRANESPMDTSTSTLRRSSRLSSDSDSMTSMMTSRQSEMRNTGILRDDGPRLPRRDSSRPRNAVHFGDQSRVRDSSSRRDKKESTSNRKKSIQRDPSSSRFECASTANRDHSRERDSSSRPDKKESTSNRDQSRPRKSRRDEIAPPASRNRSRSRTSRNDHGDGPSGGASKLPKTSTRPSRAVSRVQPDRRSKSKPKGPEIRADVSTSDNKFTSNRNRSLSPSPSPKSSRGKSSHRSRSQKPRKHKDEVSFEETIRKVHEHSIDWFTKCCIVSMYKRMDKNDLSVDVRRILDRLERDVEETDCCSAKIPVPVRNKATTTDDYRMLDKHINNLVLSVKRTGATSAPFDAKYPKGPTYTGDTFIDPSTTSAADIIEAAGNMLETGRNTIHETLDKTRMRNLISETTGALKSDVKFFEKYRQRDDIRPSQGHLPVAVYEIETNSEDDILLLKESLRAASVAVVRNACAVFKLDVDRFKLDEVTLINPNVFVDVARQIPQPTSSNYHIRNYARQTDEENWAAYLYTHEVKITELAQYHQNVETLSKRALERIIESPSTHETVLRHLSGELKSVQIPLPRNVKADRDAMAIAFGTNIDIPNGPAYAALNKEIAKLPEFVQPVGRKTFWAYVNDKLLGVNSMQVYYKVPGVRTFPHLENGCLASVNINIGMGECIWFCVPMEFAGKLQELAREMIGIKNGESIFVRGFWPVVKCCLDAGIPLVKFIQKPGDMVVVGPGTYHWVQSNEITSHIAWNLARGTFTQLAAVAISNDNYLSNQYTPMIPIEPIIWGVTVESRLKRDFRRLLKHLLCRSLFNAKVEEGFVYAKKYTLKNVNEKPNLLAVERCQMSRCGTVLFNTIPCDKDGIVTCYECLARRGLLDMKTEIVVYIRHDIYELEDKYDEFINKRE